MVAGSAGKARGKARLADMREAEEREHQKKNNYSEDGSQKIKKIKQGMTIDEGLLERARNAAWWTRRTLNEILISGVEREVVEMERINGGPFEKRGAELKRGRPLR